MKSDSKPNPAAMAIDADFEELPGGGTVLHGGANAPAQLRTTYMSAQIIARARDIRVVKKKVVDEAEMAAEGCYYSWTQGGKLVEGISIDGAMILVRNYGNCVAEAQVVKEGPTFWVFDAVFVDLESGMTTSRQYRQRKGEAHQSAGKGPAKDADRLLDIAFQIGQSKAIRNVILNALPVWLKDALLTQAKKAAEGQYDDLPKSIQAAIAGYANAKPRAITQKDLEAKLQKPIDLWTSSDLVVLDAVRRAIKARETTFDAEFPPPAGAAQAQPASTKAAELGAAAVGNTVPKEIDPAQPTNLFQKEEKKTPAAAKSEPKPEPVVEREREPGEDG